MSSAPISTRKLVLVATLEALVAVAGFWLVLIAIVLFERQHWYDGLLSGPNEDVRLAILLFVAAGGGVTLALILRRQLLRSSTRTSGEAPGKVAGPWSQLCSRSRVLRATRIALIVGYLLTWIFGVPEAIFDAGLVDVKNAERAAAWYAEQAPPEERDPVEPVRSWSVFGFPVLPGLVVTHHAHNGGKLHGWSGLKVYLWWGSGVKQAKEVVVRIS